MSSDETVNHTNRQRIVRLISSYAILIYGRMLLPVAPLVTEWHWASNYRHDENATYTYHGSTSFPQMSSKLIIISGAYPIVEILTSPFAAYIGDMKRFGCDAAILIGLLSSFVLNLLLSCTMKFWAVFIAKSMQGISHAFLLPFGLARILQLYPPGHKYHSIMIAAANCTTAFLVLKNTYAGIVVEYIGARACFWIMIPLNIMLLVEVLLHFRSGERKVTLTLLRNNRNSDKLEKQAILETAGSNVTFRSVVTDIHVLICVGSLTIAFLFQHFLVPSVGLWMDREFNAGSATTGLLWGLGGLAAIPANFFGARFANWKYDYMWLYALIHLAVCILPIAYLPYSASPLLASLSVSFYLYCCHSTRYAITILLAVIADSRYQQAYGNVMTVAEIGYAMPYLIGPLTIPFINKFSFRSTCIGMGIIYITPIWLLVFLKNIRSPASETNVAGK